MANVTIDIATQFKGRPAFKQAEKSVSTLEKAVGNLGKTFASVFAAQKVIAFGKASAQAFIADQKAATQLSNAIKNLGMDFANPSVTAFISQLQQISGVADDQLRPAFQGLLLQTKDLRKSQELLGLAIDVSRGSGQALETVTNDLAQAYVGNTKGLKKYYLGLTQAQLKAMSFTDIQKKLNDQFKGSSKEYLKTYAGQMERLTTAAGEAKETIGKGLLDSLALLGKDGSVGDLAQSMQYFADYTSNAIYGVASLANELKNLGAAAPSWLTTALKFLVKTAPGSGLINGLNALSSYGERKRNSQLENPSTLMFKQDEANNRINNIAYKKQQDAAKKQLDATKKLTAEQKKQALLKKQGTLFDMEQIQLVAALKGKLSDEERDRVKLQLALLQGNEEEASRLSAKIADTIDKTGELKRYLSDFTLNNDPFKNWMDSLERIAAKAASISSMAPAGTGATSTASSGTADYGGNIIGSLVPNFTPTTQYNTGGAATTVNVQVDGKTIASALLDQSLSGNQAYVDRRTGGFNW